MNLFLIFIVSYLHSISPTLADDLQFTDKEIKNLREEVREMFYHAYDGYMKYAIPYDELRPLTCDGHDTWGSYSLTLIDALDTLAVMDNKTEFRKVYDLISERKDFEADINVSVFETNIRIVGGLLSGHLMARRMGVKIHENWPCEGSLLQLAVDAATRLLPAFDTPTGMPYGTVNLRYGVPKGETPITCSAGVGTFLIEFGTISRLTGDPLFEEIALGAIHALWNRRSRLNLIGNHIDVVTGHWTGNDAGIGAGVDSYFEYLVKGSFLFQKPELMAIFNEARAAIDKHLRHDDWYLWKSMQRAQVSMAVFQSLEAFWPGILSLTGDIESAQKTLFNYHQVMKQYGFTPEFYSIPQGAAYAKRSGYPLRPELMESLMYLYQATKDHTFLKMGADLVATIEHSTKTSCGYATVENVVDHSLDNRMESFFLAETTKYLYLLFDENHWLHSSGDRGIPLKVGNRHCVVEAGGYFFNTEAHPIDTGALACCSGPEEKDFVLSQEELVDLILDPATFSERHEGQSLKTTPRKARPTKEAEKVQTLEEFDNYTKLSEETLNLRSQFKYTPKPPPTSKSQPEPTTPPASQTDPEEGSSSNLDDPEVKTFSTDEVSTVKEPPSDASDLIVVEKDRNKSDYERSVSGILESFEKTKEDDGVPWGPRFTAIGEGAKTKENVAEISEVASSVSSSKFFLGRENRIVEKKEEVEAKEEEESYPQNTFSIDNLRKNAHKRVLEASNMTVLASYSLLSCPLSFTENFHFKGQMLNLYE